MSEFRNATNDFKTTWEKEVAFEEMEERNEIPVARNQISKTNQTNSENIETQSGDQFYSVEKDEFGAENIVNNLSKEESIVPLSSKEESAANESKPEKRDWL